MRFTTTLLVAATMGSAAMAQSCPAASQSSILSCMGPVASITAMEATCTEAACACGLYSSVTACWSSYCAAVPIPSAVVGSANSICATVTPTGAAAGATGTGGAKPSKAAAMKEFVVPVGGVAGVMAAMLGVIAYL